MADAEVIHIDSRRAESESPRCRATTSTGRPCRNHAAEGSDYCRVHQRQAGRATSVPAATSTPDRAEVPEPPVVAPEIEEGGWLEGASDFIRRRLAGDYEIDDFGYDRDLSREVLLPMFKPLYERYFRVRTLGINRIPTEGPALLVVNHSGSVALDAVMLQCAVALEHPAERVVRSIGASLVWNAPFISHLARKAGNAVACDEDAMALLERGELVSVFPEGFKGIGKGWRERYRLQRFGRGGFIELALKARVPIIPVSIVGAEEAYPMIGDAKLLAKILGVPYFPITPTFPWLGPLGAIPLPSRWVMEFGEPIAMDKYPEDAADDKMLVFDLVDTIRDTIQQMVYKGLKYRGGTFF